MKNKNTSGVDTSSVDATGNIFRVGERVELLESLPLRPAGNQRKPINASPGEKGVVTALISRFYVRLSLEYGGVCDDVPTWKIWKAPAKEGTDLPPSDSPPHLHEAISLTDKDGNVIRVETALALAALTAMIDSAETATRKKDRRYWRDLAGKLSASLGVSSARLKTPDGKVRPRASWPLRLGPSVVTTPAAPVVPTTRPSAITRCQAEQPPTAP